METTMESNETPQAGQAAPVSNRPLLAVLALGVLISAVYYILACNYGPEGHAGTPYPDTHFFYQYARVMAEGTPYVFTPGDSPTTGSTSHLYPALLALCYKLGAKGAALGTAGFALSVISLLLTLTFFWQWVRRVEPTAAILATLMVALSGHLAVNIFSQVDMSIFVAMVMGAAAAAACGRYGWLAFAMVLCSLTRPEGLVLSFWLLVIAFTPMAARDRRAWLMAAVVGLVTYLFVLGLNYKLTGMIQFQSVLGKGYTSNFEAMTALSRSGDDWAEFVVGSLLGLGSGYRRFFIVPALGGVLALIGIFTRPWRTARTAPLEAWLLLAASSAMVLYATSGWGALAYGRYLTWFYPLWLMYAALGAYWLYHQAGTRQLARGLMALLLIWQAASSVYFMGLFAKDAAPITARAQFVELAERTLPEGSRIGTLGNAGLAYWMPSMNIINIAGVSYARFADGATALGHFEILKHEPQHRFDYWIFHQPAMSEGYIKALVGDQVLAATPVFGSAQSSVIHDARWDALDAGLEPRDEAIRAKLANRKLIARLDHGYAVDEQRARLRYFDRIPGMRLFPSLKSAKLGDQEVSDVGRVVVGSERFEVPVTAGQPVWVVWRTSTSGPAYMNEGYQEFSFASPLSLIMYLNDQRYEPAPVIFKKVDVDEAPFEEFVFELPAELITRDLLDLEIGGDHISYGFWFYQ